MIAYLMLEMVVLMKSFNKEHILMTKYHFFYHKVDLSILMDYLFYLA